MEYIDIKLVGHSYIRAFKVSEKKSAKSPDYSADGVAVWIKQSKPKQQKN